MFVVIFEVQPKKERWSDYLDLAKQLKPKLEAIEGFIDNDRFASKRDEGRVLSLSTWRDEKSVIRWRVHGEHHQVQEKGRFEIFEDYHLRVGEVIDDSDPPQGMPLAQQRFDATAKSAAKAASITEFTPHDAGAAKAVADRLATALGLDAHRDGVVDHEIFESIYQKGKLLLLVTWRDAEASAAWAPSPLAGGAQRHRRVRVIRDYGMHDRAEAPQFYPDIRREHPVAAQ